MWAITSEHVDSDQREADALHVAAQLAAALADRPDIAVLALMYALDMFGGSQGTSRERATASLN